MTILELNVKMNTHVDHTKVTQILSRPIANFFPRNCGNEQNGYVELQKTLQQASLGRAASASILVKASEFIFWRCQAFRKAMHASPGKCPRGKHARSRSTFLLHYYVHRSNASYNLLYIIEQETTLISFITLHFRSWKLSGEKATCIFFSDRKVEHHQEIKWKTVKEEDRQRERKRKRFPLARQSSSAQA
jgi:hypothetical protein